MKIENPKTITLKNWTIYSHLIIATLKILETSKQVFNLKPSRTISTLVMNNDYAETDLQKANMLNEYFSSQTVIDDINKQLPPDQHVLESIVITDQDIQDVLSHLDVTKACGPDLISPHLLKEGASMLAVFLYCLQPHPAKELLSSCLERCEHDTYTQERR